MQRELDAEKERKSMMPRNIKAAILQGVGGRCWRHYAAPLGGVELTEYNEAVSEQVNAKLLQAPSAKTKGEISHNEPNEDELPPKGELRGELVHTGATRGSNECNMFSLAARELG